MSRHVINIAAIFRKDFRLFWPLALLASIFVLAHTLGVPFLSNGLHNSALFASGLFIMALVQQDAPASLRHEWLIRPISSPEIIIAKILLMAVAIFLPALIGSVITAIRYGAGLSDAVLLALAEMQMNLVGAFLLVLLAAVTTTLIQAAAALLGLVLLQTIVHPISEPLAWNLIVFNMITGGAVVLWLQYAHRRTLAARTVLGATILSAVTAILLLTGSSGSARGQTRPMPIASPAADGILAAFKKHSLVGLGDAHGMAQQQDFYSALVTDPRFAREVGNVVVEFGNAAHQGVLDRFINGHEVAYNELRRVWTDTVGWTPPPSYLGFINLFAHIRDRNRALPQDQRIHVWLAGPPLDWSKVRSRADAERAFPGGSAYREVFPAALIEREILGKNRKALLIFGSVHFNKGEVLQSGDVSLARLLELRHPGALFTVFPYMGFGGNKVCAAEFEKDKIDWVPPVLVAPVKATALDDAGFRARCPTVKYPGSPEIVDRLNKLVAGMDGDAFLYLGPTSTLTRAPHLPDSYLDEPYAREIQRQWGLYGLGGNTSTLAVGRNPVSPQPYLP